MGAEPARLTAVPARREALLSERACPGRVASERNVDCLSRARDSPGGAREGDVPAPRLAFGRGP